MLVIAVAFYLYAWFITGRGISNGIDGQLAGIAVLVMQGGYAIFLGWVLSKSAWQTPAASTKKSVDNFERGR